MPNNLSEQLINYNILLDKAIATLSEKRLVLEDIRLLNIYFSVVVAISTKPASNDVNIHKLYVFLKICLSKMSSLDELEEKHVRIILNHLASNRTIIDDESLVFNILVLILDSKEAAKDYFNTISFIIIKIVFTFSSLPSKESLKFLKFEIIGKAASKKLVLICPGILTNLIKLLKHIEFKRDISLFTLLLENLTGLLLKIENDLSSNEKVLVYQSMNSLFKAWSNGNSSSQRNQILIEKLCLPLAHFELINELLCMEYIYRSEVINESCLYFGKEDIISLLISKVNMIDVFYFDTKSYKLLANGLRLLTFHSDVDPTELKDMFIQFVNIAATGKDKKYNGGRKNTDMDFLHFALSSSENIKSPEVMISVKHYNVKSDLEFDESLIEEYVPMEIRERWLSLVSIWAKLINNELVLECIELSEMDEKRKGLYYYIIFQITPGDEELDSFLIFDELEDKDDFLFDHFIDVIDQSSEEAMPLSTFYLINRYVSKIESKVELRELEVDLLPILLRNIENPLSQFILNKLSMALYPTELASDSFKELIRNNTDLILSQITTMIATGDANEKKWIVFAKNVFKICGMDIVRNAGDVVNTMFQVLAVSSISFEPTNNVAYERVDIMEVMLFFEVILDLILTEYTIDESRPSITKDSKMGLEDVISIFNQGNYEEEQNDCDDIEEIAADSKGSSEEKEFEGKVPVKIYKLAIEILSYTERCFPLIEPKHKMLQNISKITSIMKSNQKSFLPQLAQTIWPLLEKANDFGLSKHDFKFFIELIAKILIMEPQFMFQRVKSFYLSKIVLGKIGTSSTIKELGHVILLVASHSEFCCSDADFFEISTFLKE